MEYLGEVKMLECKLCDKTFKTTPELTRHVASVHKKVKVRYPCPYCDETLSREDNVSAHVRRYHPEKIEKYRNRNKN